MISLNESNRAYLDMKARFALMKVEENKGQKEEWRLGPIVAELHEAASMGYSIAMAEVRSTPLEVLMIRLFRDTGRGTHETAGDVVDARLAEGWEIGQVFGPDNRYMMMTRRRAVKELELGIPITPGSSE